LEYRRDIDGLRAVAVVLVIFNHIGFSFFSGGYVGVDVFFVLSGFLITAIIYPMIKENTFSITWFLSRRIKRLMPVLLFVIFITMLVFTFILLPQDLIKFYRSIIWVVLYVANFFFWIEHGGYFDGGSQEAPLLHTWSLAVEEQYYMVWPLMLLFSVRLLGAKVTAYLSIVLFIAATLFSQWGTEVTLGAAYYLLPTRFFELLLGSCLAIFWHKLPIINTKSQHALSLIGLTLIVMSSFLLTEHSQFPGYNALYPILGTALLIYSSKGIVNKFLSSTPMVFTGNISYSLYLWHWPVFVAVRYMSIEFSFIVQVSAIAVTFILATLSWKYVEQPLRYIQWNSFPKIAINMYVLPSLLITIFALGGIYAEGFKGRFNDNVVKMDEALNSYASKSRAGCHSAFRNSETLPDDNCVFGHKNSSQQTNFFVFGDSHANHLIPFFHTLAIDSNALGQDYTMDRCVPILGLNWGSNLFMANKCRERNELAKQYIIDNKFDYVVMAASWPHSTSQRIFTETQVRDNVVKKTLLQQQMDYTFNLIVNSGAIPIFIEDTPTLGGKAPKCPVKRIVFDEKLDCSITRIDNEMLNQILDDLSIKYPTLKVLNVHDLYCEEGHCNMSLDGLPLYRDDDHLNEEGAKYLGELYIKKHSNPFKVSE